LFLSCATCTKRKIDDFDIQLSAIPEFTNQKKQLRLKLSFKSYKKRSFLFDRKVFSVYDPNFENEDLLAKGMDQMKLLDSIRFSQCIIENKMHEKRFFSDIRLFENETIQAKSVFMLDPNYDTINLTSNNEINIYTDYIDVNRFKNEIDDDTIRITYFFKPLHKQEIFGFKTIVTTSNWFPIR
jgi:hypothetical protein